jgi:hypothetical protein
MLSVGDKLRLIVSLGGDFIPNVDALPVMAMSSHSSYSIFWKVQGPHGYEKFPYRLDLEEDIKPALVQGRAVFIEIEGVRKALVNASFCI